jgi:hypothetical protein
MNKQQTSEDMDMEILVNSVMAAQNACNAASAALRSLLRKRAGAASGGAPAREVPPTFMAKARHMVHNTDTPEGDNNAGQAATGGDGGGDGHEREQSDGAEDKA